MKLNVAKLTRHRTQPTTPHEVRYNCPHCNDGDGKLWANLKKGLWTCFRCGAHGTLLARDIIRVRDEKMQIRGEPMREFDWKTYPDIRGSGLLYLKRHNIPVEVALDWGVRSGKDAATSRLIVPVKAKLSGGWRTVFRVAHATSSEVLPKELQSGQRYPWILTWDDLGTCSWPKPGEERTALIVEGAADALRLSAAALSDPKLLRHTAVVCLWGKHLSEENAFTLAAMFPHFYVVLDRENGLSKQGEVLASMKLMHSLGAICTGLSTRHRWTTREGAATDPAELDDHTARWLLNTALQRTGG